MPPAEKGESPFPIFEQISASNKTIDFVVFFQYAWHHMRKAVKDKDVKFPEVIISDMSWANIHSILDFFLRTTIKDYLNVTFNHVANKESWTHSTVLAICENHLLPAMLKSARGLIGSKVLADTTVAGVMLMLRSDRFQTAIDIWKNLVQIHCSKHVDMIAQKMSNNTVTEMMRLIWMRIYCKTF